MIILNTTAHETIWGGSKLLPYAESGHKKIGHLYSLCCEEGLKNTILNGPYKGKDFHTYFLDVKNKFGLEKYKEFPLIIALVEAKDHLSIQVHPDDIVAAREENADYGKNESWYFLERPQMGGIYNGCLVATNEEVKEKMEEDNLMSVVDILPVEQGDYVYVEAGTIHALAAGSFLYEIEENSPWTYRMYDYNRTDSKGNKRELHIEKAMMALKPELKSKAIHMGDEEIKERRYSVKKLQDLEQYTNNSATLECITLIEGRCQEEGIEFTTGTTVVLEPRETLYGDIKHAVMARPR